LNVKTQVTVGTRWENMEIGSCTESVLLLSMLLSKCLSWLSCHLLVKVNTRASCEKQIITPIIILF
jgi:hypothetical protein